MASSSWHTTAAPPVLGGLALWALAAANRLRALDQAGVDSDQLGQFLAAWSASSHYLPPPPNPEAGLALWVWVWPLVHVAGDLHSLLTLRFVQGALVAPIGFAATWLLAERPAHQGARAGPLGLPPRRPRHPQWVAALVSGLLLALDPGLTDTLVSGFRGYAAPELAALVVLALALALRGHRWAPAAGALALVAASGQHPMAFGLALGALFASPWVASATGRWAMLAAGIVAAGSLLPRAATLVTLAQCGDGIATCLRRVALGSAEPDLSPGRMLARAVVDRAIGDQHGIGFVLVAVALLGMLAAARRTDPALRATAALTLGAAAGVVALGLTVESLRPYHLRIVAAPTAALIGLVLARAWPAALLLGTGAAATWWPAVPTGNAPGAVARTDTLASRLSALPSPLRVDRVWWDGPPRTEPAGIVLSAVLQGQDPSRFSTLPDTLSVITVSGGPAAQGEDASGAAFATSVAALGGELVDRGPGWAALRFPDTSAAARWADAWPEAPIHAGGAWDWDVALHPATADLARDTWPGRGGGPQAAEVADPKGR